jgi:hypothetical protein
LAMKKSSLMKQNKLECSFVESLSRLVYMLVKPGDCLRRNSTQAGSGLTNIRLN